MKDLTDVILRLKSIKGDISLSDLIDMGLNQYYIKRLVNDGILFKVGRAKYQTEIPNCEDSLVDNLIIIEEESAEEVALENASIESTSSYIDVDNHQEENATEVAEENISIESTSSYIDVDNYQEEIAQINSLIQSGNYNGLSIYVASMGYTAERLLDLEEYVLEKMYNLGLFVEAEPYYQDLEVERKAKPMLDEMFKLKMKSIIKND